MRLFTSFIALYMVLLSLAPCGDKKDCKINSTQPSSISIADHSSEGSHTEEACTPFCSCSCCSISMLKSNNVYPTKINEEHRDININYSNARLPLTAHSIWQPPKLV
ncbi:hypothetical protein C8N28_2673 [Albibacterium bauzanense]|uniref:Uncharacterized protein n=1 Tax=Albibacterium bauzanense TaxID=653929 RepID=A0A4R1LPA8_9SPHI|nr:hypothetical protein C8N28_2673 [Albibacterium bauzanense]